MAHLTITGIVRTLDRDGGNCMGYEFLLSDGQKLGGIKSFETSDPTMSTLGKLTASFVCLKLDFTDEFNQPEN